MLDPKWQSKYKDEDWSTWLGLKKFYLGNRQYDIDRIYPEHKAQINYLLDKYYVTNAGNHTSTNDKNLYTKLNMLQRVMTDMEYAESPDNDSNKWQEQMDAEQDPYDVFRRNEEIKQNRAIASRELMINKISYRESSSENIKFWISPEGRFFPWGAFSYSDSKRHHDHTLEQFSGGKYSEDTYNEAMENGWIRGGRINEELYLQVDTVEKALEVIQDIPPRYRKCNIVTLQGSSLPRFNAWGGDAGLALMRYKRDVLDAKPEPAIVNASIRLSKRDVIEEVAKYWDQASKEFGDYYRQLKKKKKKSSISLRDLTKIANDGEHEWNCLMIDYPEDMASKIIAWGEKNIDEDNLYIDKEDPSYGREKHIHTTISYGIKPDIDFEKIKDECDLKPLNVSLGEVSKFDTDDKFDVIKITVEGSDLHDLHKKIEDEIGCPGNTYPDYKPHLTIAYVKKGSCDNLLGSAPFKGEKFILNNYDYSQAGKENKHIKHTANYIPNPKSTMPSPIKRNFDYGEIPNWIDRVEYETKKRQKARNKRKAAINSILK